MAIRYTEAALWDAYQCVVFNETCLRNAVLTADFASRNTLTRYSVDFSDIHPGIFPEIAEAQADREEFVVHSRSVTVMWDILTQTDASALPFKLGIGPGARFEIFENLWHVDQKVAAKISEYLPPDIQNASLSCVRQYVEKIDMEAFSKELGHLLADDTVDARIRKPMKRLAQLLDSGILQQFEETLPSEVRDRLPLPPPEDQNIDTVLGFLERNPRAPAEASGWTEDHAHFHDMIDTLDILQIRALTDVALPYGCHPALLSHTFRVIRAGELIRQQCKGGIVHHPGAALYVARATEREGPKRARAFLESGAAQATVLHQHFDDYQSIAELKVLSPSTREARFRKGTRVLVQEEVDSRLNGFLSDIYSAIDDSFRAKESSSSMSQRRPYTSGTSNDVTVDDVTDMLERASSVRSEVQHHAKAVRGTIGGPHTALGGLYLPQIGHAKTVSDWLEAL